MADGYRITEGGVDLRVDEALNNRVTEGFSASGNGITFVGTGTLTAFPRATMHHSVILNADGLLSARNRSSFYPGISLEAVGNLIGSPTSILFSSAAFINVGGVWKSLSIFVNSDSIWASPVKISYKVSGIWVRVY